MKCPTCSLETRHTGTSTTLVGYGSPDGHDHDDNCWKRRYRCANGHEWIESRRTRCPACDWRGKETCHCHGGPKVDDWTDPEDYLTDEFRELVKKWRA